VRQPWICIIAGSFAAVFASAQGEPSPVHASETRDKTSAMAMGTPLPTTLAGWSRGARLFDGLGNYHRLVSTKSPEAQRYFDQGMRLLWGFNHDESTRSFARALELDPTCAMCAWGVALTVGPNYNVPMLAEARAKIAFEATTRAQSLAGSAAPVEQALISTLAQRYPNAEPLDPQSNAPILTAHAAAMRSVARRYPADLDVQALYAESMMNVHAWKLWSPDGTPAEGTAEIITTLESVLKRDPMHMGALHYYVHAVEASPHPEKGLAAAARLLTIAPSAGHLLHMPAHIFHRVGRYEESAEANRKGAAADVAYLAKTNPIDYYPAMYVSHNYQFLAYSAAAEGREAETLDAVRRSAGDAGHRLVCCRVLHGTGAFWTMGYVARGSTPSPGFGKPHRWLLVRNGRRACREESAGGGSRTTGAARHAYRRPVRGCAGRTKHAARRARGRPSSCRCAHQLRRGSRRGSASRSA